MKTISRRSFLQNMGAGIGATAIAATLPGATMHYPIRNNFTGKKLNIALCGLGRYAGILGEGFAFSQHCRLAGIVTGTSAKALAWKKQYNIPEKNIYDYQHFDEIVNNKEIDLVYVVLPNAMHKEYVIRAAKAGKHVISEKPLATSVKDAEEMIKACKDAGVQLAVGYRLHYEPFNMELKRLGQEKVFGPVRLIEASLGYKVDDNKEWRLHKAMSGGGPLMNLGIYCVQVSRYILGEEPVSVTAQFNPVTNKDIFNEVEASITWQLNFPSGAVCNSTSSYTSNIDRVYAAADNGFFELSPAISYGPFKGRSSKEEFNFSTTINQQAAQMDGIAQYILANKPLPLHICGEEGLKDNRIMAAIYESAETGRKVSLV